MDSHNWSLKETQWEREYDSRLEEYSIHHLTSDTGIKGVVVSDYESQESYIMINEDFCVDIEV